jgi:hypothetical protein
VQILNGNLECLFNYCGIHGNKLRPFRLSNNGAYWIGVTDKGEEFWFNGENSKEIMNYNWHVSNGYLVSKINKAKYIRLNRKVLGITDKDIVVNHRGGNKMDNRVEMLSISDHKDNMKELLPSIRNNTGITGLSFNEKNNKYKINCTVNGFSYTDVYKFKDEALIDLLIIQRNYRYRHNDNLYYMLENISDEYINKLIEKVENNIKNRKVNPVICKNRFELSEDGSFYWMYDKKNNKCKISIEDFELVKQGNWRYILNNGKEYFSGEIIHNGKRKGVFLHRFLMDLIDTEYRHWYIDHLNSDGLDNTRENIIITDAQGNGINKKRKNINRRKDKFKSEIIIYGKFYYKSFDIYEDAEKWRDELIKKSLKERHEFKSKSELDNYLRTIK